ncbi:hypothetical protein IWQ56_003578, partial [Coemansia nantahalensis]
RLVEVFKAFNSRSCQVVLGAGAMRSAGLKNISAKHLALASESLSLCMELIPHVKECLRRAIPPSGEALLAQLERTAGDFASHQQELHSKLVVIMADRADHHARALDATRWDELGQQAQPPAPAMDALVKEMRKLHKVLKRYLPPPALRSVFERIFAMYETKLTAQYRRMRIATSEGKRQLMLNSQFLLRRLRALDAAPPVDWELEVVVNNIDLVRSQLDRRIIGGADASGGVVTSTVFLTATDVKGRSWTCGGTVITDQVVITAAHCVIDRDGNVVPPNQVEISYGGTSRSRHLHVTAQAVVPHPNYSARGGPFANDIAVIKTSNHSGASMPDQIKSVPVQIGDAAACQRVDPSYQSSDGPRICVLNDSVGGSGTCQGDSGSSLLAIEDGQIFLTGITSQGGHNWQDDRCGIPGGFTLFTHVGYYLDFIRDAINSA